MKTTKVNIKKNGECDELITLVRKNIQVVMSDFKNQIKSVNTDAPGSFSFDVRPFVKIKDPQRAFNHMMNHSDLLREFALYMMMQLDCSSKEVTVPTVEPSKN